MITTELIRENQALKDLSDDQVKLIVTLSENDEKTVKNQLFGEIHGKYDKIFAEILGVEKPTSGKVFSTDFWSAEVRKLKEVADKSGDNTELELLKGTIADLETQIKAGQGNKALTDRLEAEKAALLKEKNELTQSIEKMRGQVTEIETSYKTQLEKRDQEFEAIMVDQYLDQQLTGIKFKDSIPENLRVLALKDAKNRLKSEYQPVKVDDGNGGFTWQFKKGDVIANNPANGLKPYTGQELLLPHLSEIIDTGKFQPGGGTKVDSKKPGFNGELIDVTGAKTRDQAMDMIKSGLAVQGISVTDKRYSEIKNKTWEVVKQMNLPQTA